MALQSFMDPRVDETELCAVGACTGDSPSMRGLRPDSTTEPITQSKETSMLQIVSASASIARLSTNVPRELRETPQWIYWRGADRIDKRTGEVKLSKLPIDPKTLQTADKTDPRVWGTFADCCAGIA